MKRWLFAFAIACSAKAPDPVVEDFRGVERRSIAAFNQALHDQRDNKLDEIGVANAVERDALQPWRAMAARVAAAPEPAGKHELYTLMRRYTGERLEAWEAYVAGLRAPSEAEARGKLDSYHQKNADAQRDAQLLGAEIRRY